MLYIGTLFFAFQTAVTSYVNSSFIKGYLGGLEVGIIYSASALFTLITLALIPHALNRFGNYKSIMALSAFSLIALTGMITLGSSALVILLFILYLVINTLIGFCLDIFIESHTQVATTGRTRGTYLTVISIAWVLAPIFSGFLATAGYQNVYAIAALALLPLILILKTSFSHFKDARYIHPNVRQTTLRLMEHPDLRYIFTASTLLHLFYSWMIIFTPIYLHEVIGFDWGEIGIIFTLMLLPFVLLDYVLGKLSDTKLGEKELLVAGFAIMSIATAFLTFTHTSSVIVFAIILFVTRIGAATVEVMSDSYFFKKVGAEDSEMISFFRNASPIAYLIGPIIATVFMLFVPMNMLFIIMSFILIFGIYAALKIKDTN